jgi:hypothetical protein
VPAVQHFLSSQRLSKTRNIAVEPHFSTGINVGLALNGFNGSCLVLSAASESFSVTLMMASANVAQHSGPFLLDHLLSAAFYALGFTPMTASASIALHCIRILHSPLTSIILFIRPVDF